MTKPYSGNGRKFGYPTANIASDTSLQDGVYFGYATMAGLIDVPALIFIGTPTTVGDIERRVEAHLLDIVDKDYYGESILLDIKYFHRPNQTFDTIDQLLDNMQADDTTARKWFAQA